LSLLFLVTSSCFFVMDRLFQLPSFRSIFCRHPFFGHRLTNLLAACMCVCVCNLCFALVKLTVEISVILFLCTQNMGRDRRKSA